MSVSTTVLDTASSFKQLRCISSHGRILDSEHYDFDSYHLSIGTAATPHVHYFTKYVRQCFFVGQQRQTNDSPYIFMRVHIGMT